MGNRAFLRIPPFPGHRGQPLAVPARAEWGAGEDPAQLVRALREARVGGTFWGMACSLPAGRDIVLAPDTQEQARFLLDQANQQGNFRRVVLVGPFASADGVPVVSRLCDPWSLAEHAKELRVGAGNELALVGMLCAKPVTVVGEGRFAALRHAPLEECVAGELVRNWAWRDPFTGALAPASQTIELLADWRRLIDANRDAKAVYGIALWKRVTMNTLLWDGSGPVRYARRGDARTGRLVADDAVLAWKTRAAPQLSAELGSRGVTVGEIEDGMIRSTGLGANCVPPLSVIVDFCGAHFDPAQPSGLERILQHDEISLSLLERASALRHRLVRTGISKYGIDPAAVVRPEHQCRRVLVTGQVEDDRSMLTGGAGCSNLDAVRRAREIEPDAWIIYKPHPDVEAGHRKGAIPDDEVLRFANEVERKAPVAGLLDSVDAVHVITSLTGFEALMREKEVVTHGVPFYAGWGLTRDLGPVPARRTRRRSLDELVAATLILYPRYIDPVTRLPCPVEVLVERMAQGEAKISSPLVRIREAQGRLNVAFQNLRRQL